MNENDEPTPYEKVLAILSDHDYNDGAGLRWHPTGEPTERAVKVAERIIRELGISS